MQVAVSKSVKLLGRCSCAQLCRWSTPDAVCTRSKKQDPQTPTRNDLHQRKLHKRKIALEIIHRDDQPPIYIVYHLGAKTNGAIHSGESLARRILESRRVRGHKPGLWT